MTTETTTTPKTSTFSISGPYLSEGRLNIDLAQTDLMWLSLKVNAEGGENAVHAHTNEDLVSLLVSLHLHEPLGVLQAAFRQFACISVSVLFACISECACLGRFCEPNVFSRLEIALPPSRCTCGCCHVPEVSRRPTQARCNDY